ncbi:OmpA family protein [Vibrio hippocampi]|uniref:Outer membrane protein A n=1 Tax=Vibrio hippocampi TaxID=654686 RepID=A0ABN8DS56_9VIBR|nr:OmpA family protein [Vibrio hippocampi]CAH0529842.1 Outer membrane protein A [Vibrio hippocampi]
MKKTVVAIALSGIVAIPAAMAEGFYLGGRLGGSELNDACNISGTACDDSQFSAGFFTGYEWNEYLALEFAYDYLGNFETSFVQGSTGYLQDDTLSALTLAPKLSYPFTDTFSVFGKLGAAYTTYGDRDDTVLMGGLGLEYDFATAWSGRLEYQRLNDISDGWFKTDVDTFWLGVSYSFGNTPAAVVVAPAPAPTEPVMVTVTKTKTFEQVSGQEYFAFNSSKLAAERKGDFDPLIALLKEHPQANVEIVGHTDSIGSAAINQTISEARATTIASYLESQGIDSSRMTVKGMGESTPVASNETKEGRAQNRRVEILVPAFEYMVDEVQEMTK